MAAAHDPDRYVPPAPTVVELAGLMDELQGQASNYGHTTDVGRLCIRAHDALYAIAIAVLEEER